MFARRFMLFGYTDALLTSKSCHQISLLQRKFYLLRMVNDIFDRVFTQRLLRCWKSVCVVVPMRKFPKIPEKKVTCQKKLAKSLLGNRIENCVLFSLLMLKGKSLQLLILLQASYSLFLGVLLEICISLLREAEEECDDGNLSERQAGNKKFP